MLRIFTLLICAGILLSQGCSSSKVKQPPTVESKIPAQAPKSLETTKEQAATDIQKDSQAMSPELDLKYTEPAELIETQNLSDQGNRLIEQTENTNQVVQKAENSLPKAGQELKKAETELDFEAKFPEMEVGPNTEIASPDRQPKELQQTTASVIQIEDPWVRAVPPNANNSAIFLDLRNESGQLRKLVEVHSEVAERVELHTTKDEDGMLRKQRLEEVPIPALETQSFHPGGIHIMLIGLRSPLEVGGVIELELVYADQSKETISIPVDERPLLPITAQNNHSPDSLTTRTQ
jgi:copper(I)-binding protein|tara:strand:+ start:724 stop:1602 length:879 start_codon:yes stop_codon:yes gene_type:complete